MSETKFALKELPIMMPDEKVISLWFDGNGKITLNNGTFENPVANAFSLVQVKDCPFATPTCTSVCYVHKLEKAEQEVHDKYQRNSKAIREIISQENYWDIAVAKMVEYIKTNCQAGFRWHVSGDIFSEEYAYFVAMVSASVHPIKCWIYTRSFRYVPPLLGVSFSTGVDNLIVNLSCDIDNYQEAKRVHEVYGLRLCYLTVKGEVPKDLPPGSVIFPSYELRGRDLSKPTDADWWKTLSMSQKQMVCPPDFFGQGPNTRCGPCQKCLKPSTLSLRV